MPTITYADLITPLDRDSVISTAIGILSAAGFPTTAWGPTDEPRAIVEFEAAALVELSQTIAAIGKMGITQDAEDDALTLHASDVFDEDRKLALPFIGSLTLTDTTGSPQSFVAGDLLFVSKVDPSLIFINTGSVSVSAFGSASCVVAAEQVGAKYAVSGADIDFATPHPGLTLTVASGLGWVTQTGTDVENDASLRLRCQTKFPTLTPTGSADAYFNWALSSTSEINRVRIQEDPTAVDPSPMVTVYVASESGGASTSAVAAATAYITARRPNGTRVSVQSAGTYSVTVQGAYKVRSAHAATAAAYISSKFGDWFAGKDIEINGETVQGLGIGDGVYVSQVYEIIMSAPGVVSVTLTDGTNNLPSATWGECMSAAPAASDVPTLITSTSLLVPTLV